jgi:hypothetical protein
MTEKLPIVMYMFRGLSRETGGREMGFGYFMERDGQHWCIPNEDDAGLQVFPSGAFQIDLSQLREQTNRGFDRKLYHYLREVEIGPPENQTPPPRSFGGQQQVY